MTEQQASVKTTIGKVVSTKMDKTIVVEVESKVKHPLYKKYVKRFSKMHAHDPKNESKEGDVVAIRQTRPISKTKSWILVQVVKSVEK